MDVESWDTRYAATDLVWSAAPNQFVADGLADLPPGRALDLAAGEGRNAIWLAGRGWDVTALDFSKVALDKGRAVAEAQGLGDPITWLQADATTWRADSSYDLVVVAYLQLPPDQRRAAHRHAFAALEVGGTFFLVAHDSTNLVEGTGGPQDPMVLMEADDVLSDLGGSTFDVIRAERIARVVESGHHGEPDRTAYDCLVRVVRTA
ncbi:cyclopropane-fatty-acyl-phospholipid synthase family protein [Nocardioides sp.]|uniref:SAM-dependent methyltransferase n=1 Tax=Nocardioides sp. TaxID=35761 RepID=UPI003565CC76